MSNNFYNQTSNPTPSSPGSSAQLRTEFANIAAGFDKLPVLTGNGDKLVKVNTAGTALESTSALTNMVLTGGSINNTPIGATTPSTVNATTVNATVGLTGNLTGNVAGNLTGNVTSAGTSTFQNVTINGTLDMNAGSGNTITGLSTPSAASDAATKSYVDTSVAALVSSAPGTLDTLDELAAALGDDPNFATTVTNSIATKLPLAGGTMSGAIAMGSNKITGLGTPTAGNDAVNKTYIDTLYGSTVAAAASASAAATSEANAATSASTAATQAGNASNSAIAAAATYDAFDDRYLGSKASNPTLDNDGNALLTGALYFNTTVNEMRVWNGSAWLTAYNPATGALTSSGYTMSTARLIGRTTASTGATEEITVGSGLSLSAGTLSASASATLTISNKTGAYTVVAGDNGTVINCTSGTFSVALTAAATLGAGFNVQIWNTGSGTITVDPSGSELVDGSDVTTNLTLGPGSSLSLACNGTGWKTFATSLAGSGLNSIRAGAGATSAGANAVSIGSFSAASQSNATAFGSGSTASGAGAVAIGANTSATSSYATAIGSNSGGGNSVAVTGSGAMALGGSYASGQNSFAAAIGNNTSTYGAQGTQSVAMGQQAKATAQSAICLSTSGGCNASGQYSVVFGGGWQGASVATGIGSYAFGMDAVSSQAGKYAYASKGIAAAGDAQYGLIVLKASTTGSTVVMTSDGSAASTTNQLIVATGQVMAFTGTLIGKQSGSANIAAYEIKGTLVNNGGTVTMPSGTLTLIGTDSITLTTAPTIAADNANKGIALTSGAKAATNIRWVATIRSSELTYA